VIVQRLLLRANVNGKAGTSAIGTTTISTTDVTILVSVVMPFYAQPAALKSISS